MSEVIGTKTVVIDGQEHTVTVYAPHNPTQIHKAQGRGNKAMVREISFGGIIGNGRRVWAPTLDETERKMR